MKTPEEIKKGLSEPEMFCSHCQHSGEPHGCNRPNGSCQAFDNADYALDYIHQLEAQVLKWISVEDRLPQEGVSVAVYINEGNGAYWIQTAYLNGGKWRIPGEYVVDRNITHWVQLPEPPEEDEHGT